MNHFWDSRFVSESELSKTNTMSYFNLKHPCSENVMLWWFTMCCRSYPNNCWFHSLSLLALIIVHPIFNKGSISHCHRSSSSTIIDCQEASSMVVSRSQPSLRTINYHKLSFTLVSQHSSIILSLVILPYHLHLTILSPSINQHWNMI